MPSLIGFPFSPIPKAVFCLAELKPIEDFVEADQPAMSEDIQINCLFVRVEFWGEKVLELERNAVRPFVWPLPLAIGR